MSGFLNKSHNNIVTTKGHVFMFALENGCLLIKAKGEQHHLLTAQDTHKLLNLLYVNRMDIIEANVEAREYVNNGYPERRKSRKSEEIAFEPS